MSNRKSACDAGRLRQLLEDQLPSELCDATREHLDHCAECRDRLETLAGEPTWWSDASRFLSMDETEKGWRDADTGVYAGADSEDWVGGPSLDFLEPSDNPAALGKLHRLEVLEILGRGGMGIVLKAYDAELNRFVAVKALAPAMAQSSAARRRFAREAQAAAAVLHPNVLAIHNVDATGKLPYLVMPFVAGESLQQRLDAAGPLTLPEVLRIGLQAARGLAAAHEQGLVHRDVKPANILLEKGVDRVMLTDFGLARAVDDATLTRSGFIAGTPQYMSPEQAQGENVDHRSDLFSLGSVLYASCAGRPPFRAETTLGVLRRITEEDPRPVREVNPDIPEWFENILRRLLAKRPGDRYATATELADLLEKCLAHVQHPTRSPLPFVPSAPIVRTRRDASQVRWLLGAGVLAVVAGLAFFLGRSSTPAPTVEPKQPTNVGGLGETQPREAPPPVDPVEPVLDWGNQIDAELAEINARLNWIESSFSVPTAKAVRPSTP